MAVSMKKLAARHLIIDTIHQIYSITEKKAIGRLLLIRMFNGLCIGRSALWDGTTQLIKRLLHFAISPLKPSKALWLQIYMH